MWSALQQGNIHLKNYKQNPLPPLSKTEQQVNSCPRVIFHSAGPHPSFCCIKKLGKNIGPLNEKQV